MRGYHAGNAGLDVIREMMKEIGIDDLRLYKRKSGSTK